MPRRKTLSSRKYFRPGPKVRECNIHQKIRPPFLNCHEMEDIEGDLKSAWNHRERKFQQDNDQTTSRNAKHRLRVPVPACVSPKAEDSVGNDKGPGTPVLSVPDAVEHENMKFWQSENSVVPICEQAIKQEDLEMSVEEDGCNNDTGEILGSALSGNKVFHPGATVNHFTGNLRSKVREKEPSLPLKGVTNSSMISYERKLWISDLDSRITECHLAKLLKCFGTVNRLVFYKGGLNKDQPSSSCFATFARHLEAEAAIGKLNGRAILDKCIAVKWAHFAPQPVEAEPINGNSDLDEPEVIPTCDTCHKTFSRKCHLDRHLIFTKCSPQPAPADHNCEVCGKKFARKCNLTQHLGIHTGQARIKKFKCNVCEKHFSDIKRYKIHGRLHTGETPFKCDLCPKAFRSPLAASKHRRVHTGEKPYVCPDCGLRFSWSGTLHRHRQVIHKSEKPHKCPFCEKAFSQKGGLKAHLFFHTGENGFKCHKCDKTFNRKGRLLIHIQSVHDKLKSYICEHCAKGFTRVDDLNRHLVIHTGERNFLCPTCNKNFAYKYALKLHLLSHTEEVQFLCDQCGSTFLRKNSLVYHQQTQHKAKHNKMLKDSREEDG